MKPHTLVSNKLWQMRGCILLQFLLGAAWGSCTHPTGRSSSRSSFEVSSPSTAEPGGGRSPAATLQSDPSQWAAWPCTAGIPWNVSFGSTRECSCVPLPPSSCRVVNYRRGQRSVQAPEIWGTTRKAWSPRQCPIRVCTRGPRSLPRKAEGSVLRHPRADAWTLGRLCCRPESRCWS